MGQEVWKIGRPSFARYAGFAAVTILFTLLLMMFSAIVPNLSGEAIVNILFGIAFLFFWGSPIWVPVMLFSLVPGFFVYRWMVGKLLPSKILPMLSVSTAALVVSIQSSIGIPVGLRILSPERSFFEFFSAAQFWPLIFGAPAAVLSALLVLYKRDTQ
ncbi:hypothetical protein [Ruegeria halocynthiae]|uniref:hypothetical protein n=1 Tax=Ruegeria halocynthiae TaxID=985054 RepID=UPI00055AF8C9|nr:hypothetical protein [Ruegeria halocynthiae]